MLTERSVHCSKIIFGSIKKMSPVGLILNAQSPYTDGAELLFLLPFLLGFLLGFFNVVLDHELAPECNLLADKITQHFWVASHNLNALCF